MKFEEKNFHFQLAFDEYGNININHVTEDGKFLATADTQYIGDVEGHRLSEIIESSKILAGKYISKLMLNTNLVIAARKRIGELDRDQMEFLKYILSNNTEANSLSLPELYAKEIIGDYE